MHALARTVPMVGVCDGETSSLLPGALFRRKE